MLFPQVYLLPMFHTQTESLDTTYRETESLRNLFHNRKLHSFRKKFVFLRRLLHQLCSKAEYLYLMFLCGFLHAYCHLHLCMSQAHAYNSQTSASQQSQQWAIDIHGHALYSNNFPSPKGFCLHCQKKRHWLETFEKVHI